MDFEKVIFNKVSNPDRNKVGWSLLDTGLLKNDCQESMKISLDQIETLDVMKTLRLSRHVKTITYRGFVNRHCQDFHLSDPSPRPVLTVSRFLCFLLRILEQLKLVIGYILQSTVKIINRIYSRPCVNGHLSTTDRLSPARLILMPILTEKPPKTDHLYTSATFWGS